jgi:Zn-dependent protease with chaperone function
MFAQQKTGRPVFAGLLALTLAFNVLLSGCRSGGGNVGVPGQKQAPQFKPGFNLMSPQQDIAIGKQNAMQIERQMRLLPDQEVQRYISAIGQKLAAKAPGEKFPYQFKVVDTKEVNAFALPGGFLYVNRGAIEAARNEAELAGVMAHEVSHSALRHGTSQMTKQIVAEKGLQLAAAILSSRDNGGGMSGQMIGMLGSGALNLAFLKFGRTAEKEADITGAQIMASAGYNPAAMAGFFETLLKMGGPRPPEMMSDHPDPGNRVKYLNELVPKLSVAPNAITDTPEFQRIRARLRGLPAGASRQLARQAPSTEVARPPAPSSQMATLTAPDQSYQLAIPSNWQQITDGELLVFAPQGAAGRSENGLVVTHGVFVGTLAVEGNDSARLHQAFIEMQLRDNPEMQPLDSPKQTEIGGLPAIYTPIGGNSPVTGRPERDVIVTTVLPNGKLFYIVLISPVDEAQSYNNAFQQLLGSIRFAG